MERWTISRPVSQQVRPIELWDRQFSGELLYRRVGSERAEAMRAASIPDAHIGAALGKDLGRALRVVRREAHFHRVRVDGGLAGIEGLRGALQEALETPTSRGRGGEHAGELGARRLLRRRRLTGGVVVDVGQTSLAVSVLGRGAAERTTRPRDLSRLPIERADEAPLSDLERLTGYRALVAFVAEAVADAASPDTAPVLVLGLPAEVSRDGVPGHCTYAGLAGHADFCRDVLEAAAPRLSPSHPWRDAAGRAFVLNDAELAAYAVRPSPGERWLALTLGFGPGGALVDG